MAARSAILEPRNTPKTRKQEGDLRTLRASRIQFKQTKGPRMAPMSRKRRFQGMSQELIHTDLIPASAGDQEARCDQQGRIVGDLGISGCRQVIEREPGEQQG
jgi:hypothetical protein